MASAFYSFLSGLFRRSRAAGKMYLPREGAFTLPYTGESSALRVGAVYRCVRLLSESVASLPVQFMHRRGEVFVPDMAGRLHYLLNVQPDAACSAFDFWRGVVQHVLLDGNAYIVPVCDGSGEISRLVLCSRRSVHHDTVLDTYTVDDTWNLLRGVFDEQEVIHIKGPAFNDPKHGCGVLEYARLTAATAAAGDRETHKRFAKGGNVRGILSNDRSSGGSFGMYKTAELDKAAASMDERLSAGENILGVPGDSRFQQLTMSSSDMQFLESRKFTVVEICRFFGVHPSFVYGDTAGSNYKSVEQANVAFLSHTLNPLLRSIESELLRKLVPAGRAHRHRVQFDRRGLYACDLDSRVRYQTQTLAAGIYTINDWRREENKEPVAGGDTVLVSANLRGIAELGTPAPSEQNQASDI